MSKGPLCKEKSCKHPCVLLLKELTLLPPAQHMETGTRRVLFSCEASMHVWNDRIITDCQVLQRKSAQENAFRVRAAEISMKCSCYKL